MSSYEDYDKISGHYDKTRIPIGVEIILGCLVKSGRALNQMKVLDAGCGTGNYSEALLDHVNQIEAVDINRSMLKVASAKLRTFRREKRIAFHQARIDHVPFKNDTFDAVMVNQVLHHIEDQANAGYPGHCRVFREFHRVLRPKGLLVINTCSHEQLLHGYWYYNLIPEAVEALCCRYVPLNTLRKLLLDCGFIDHGSFVPLDAVCRGEAHFDHHGPLKNEWRAGDSIFALLTDRQLERLCTQIRAMDSEGELSHYVEEHDKRRGTIGQMIFIFASRD